MKTLFAILFAIVMVGGACSATAYSFSNNSPVIAQRGCCSHHGGVSGCDQNGRVICRDGSPSPSCRC